MFCMSRIETHKREKGFTLIELMVAISILGVLISLALPNFRTLMINQQIRAAAQELHSSLMLARAEAVKLNGAVRVVAEGSSWQSGWRMWRLDDDGTIVGDELRIQDGFDNVVINEDNSATNVTFNRSGRLTGGNVEFSLCITDGTERKVMIDAGGMARVERGEICP